MLFFLNVKKQQVFPLKCNSPKTFIESVFLFPCNVTENTVYEGYLVHYSEILSQQIG